MASAYLYPVSAYPAPSSAYPAHSSAYQDQVKSMLQSAPVVYPNMPVAPPGLGYSMTLPGYSTSGTIQNSKYTIKSSYVNSKSSFENPETQCLRPVLPINGTIPNPPVQIQQYGSVVPNIIPTRDWLLDTLKRYVFTNRGIVIGDYAKYEIRKRDCLDKFHKRIAELYPSNEYNITKEWITSAIANLDFLPEFAERFNTFPRTAEFKITINESDFLNLAKDIIGNIELYFNIQVESDIMLDTNVKKINLCFTNKLIPEEQKIVFYVGQTLSTNPLGILIPHTEMKYQHDYLAFDGNTYSVLDTYPCNGELFQDSNVDSSITLFEIVNNIRNGINIFMAHVDIEECRELILAARNINISQKAKKEQKQTMVFDKFISPRVKLDFYIKIRDISESISADVCTCTRCNVAIESGEIVCFTKCCRQTMHSSCLLEIYCHDDTQHSQFRCDKCRVKRNDKYGKNTEMLMTL